MVLKKLYLQTLCLYYIYWAKLSRFSRFSRELCKLFHEYKCLSLMVLNNEHLWLRQRESISMKTLMVLKL